jgi:hypothetical protein
MSILNLVPNFGSSPPTVPGTGNLLIKVYLWTLDHSYYVS